MEELGTTGRASAPPHHPSTMKGLRLVRLLRHLRNTTGDAIRYRNPGAFNSLSPVQVVSAPSPGVSAPPVRVRSDYSGAPPARTPLPGDPRHCEHADDRSATSVGLAEAAERGPFVHLRTSSPGKLLGLGEHRGARYAWVRRRDSYAWTSPIRPQRPAPAVERLPWTRISATNVTVATVSADSRDRDDVTPASGPRSWRGPRRAGHPRKRSGLWSMTRRQASRSWSSSRPYAPMPAHCDSLYGRHHIGDSLRHLGAAAATELVIADVAGISPPSRSQATRRDPRAEAARPRRLGPIPDAPPTVTTALGMLTPRRPTVIHPHAGRCVPPHPDRPYAPGSPSDARIPSCARASF